LPQGIADICKNNWEGTLLVWVRKWKCI